MDLNLAADIAGRTPFYLYDFAAVRHRVAELRAALPDGVLLHYAIKANPMPALVQRLAPLVDGLDVASHGELLTALGTAVDREQISFAGPGKRDPELAAAIAAGVVVNVESGDELARLRRIETAVGRSARFALRVNPDFQLSGSGMTMGGGADPVRHRRRGGRRGAARAGPARTVRAAHLRRVAEPAPGRADHRGQPDVRAGRPAGTRAPAGARARQHRRRARHPVLPPRTRRWTWPRTAGTWPWRWSGGAAATRTPLSCWSWGCLVGEAGVFVSRVVERKHSRGETFLVVDGGMHHHLAASGNFGQVVRRNYPVSAVTAKPADERETVTVVGPLCTPLDTLGRRVELPRCEVGDLVVVHQSGAYGPTASPVHFLGHPAPVEVLL